MFLGTHSPRLDEKGRLFLPAKFRERLADGLVVTRGQERCLYVFPMDEFVRVTEQMQAAPITSKAVRDYLRVFLSGASDEVPDKQGRVTIPAGLRDYAGLTRDCTVIGAGSRVEVWDTAAWTAYLETTEQALRRPVRGGDPGPPLTRWTTGCDPGPCGQVSSRSASRDAPSPVPGPHRRSGWRPDRRDRPHVPHAPPPSQHDHPEPHASTDLQDTPMSTRGMRRGAARPRPARPHRRAARRRRSQRPGAVFLDGTLGMGGHAEALLAACPQARARRHRPRPARRSRWPAERLAPYGDRAHLRARGVRRAARGPRRRWAWPRSTPRSSTSASPRCSSTRPTAASPTASDAPLDMRMDQTRRHHRRRGPQHLRRRRPRADPARVRRGAVRPRDRRGHRPRARSRSRSPPRPGSSSCSSGPSRPRRRRAAATPASAPSRRCASRSTPSWRPGRARCPRAVDALAVGGRIAVLATTRSRTGITKRVLARGAQQQHPAGPAGRAARARGIPAAAHPRRRGAQRGRAGREPPRRLGPAAGRRAHPTHATKGQHRMSQHDGDREGPPGPRDAGRRPPQPCGWFPPRRATRATGRVRHRCAWPCSRPACSAC